MRHLKKRQDLLARAHDSMASARTPRTWALIEHVRNSTGTNWRVEAAELPVHVQGQGARIDVVLRRCADKQCFLVVECKRANPALSNWCFARAPFVHRDRDDLHEPLFLERLQWNGHGAIGSCADGKGSFWKFAYHIACEVRSDQKGDPTGKAKGAIEDAASQVCRGLNGMVEFLSNNLQMVDHSAASGQKGEVFLFPAIFTTAKLWAADDLNLKRADLQTGKISRPPDRFTEMPFLLYQYHLSPGIKHSKSPGPRPSKMGDLMDSEYVRSIAIVSPSGVNEFLKWSSDLDLW